MPDVITILGFDPAFGITGWCVVEFNTISQKFLVKKTGLFKISPKVRLKLYRGPVAYFGRKVVEMDYLDAMLKDMVATHKPDYVASEDVYVDRRRIKAFRSLDRWLATAELFLHSIGKNLFKVATKSAKLSITGTGGASKFSVQDIILARDDIEFKQKDICTLSEHEADAIAVVHHFGKVIYPTLGENHGTVYAEPSGK